MVWTLEFCHTVINANKGSGSPDTGVPAKLVRAQSPVTLEYLIPAMTERAQSHLTLEFLITAKLGMRAQSPVTLEYL